MKKVLAVLMIIAVAALGAPVFAADEKPMVAGNVEIYGRAHLSVDVISTDDQASGADKNLINVSSNSSRIGFKGSEDLGSGLKAVYQLELGVNMDKSESSPTLRNSYVGLSGGFGTVILGTHDTPYKTATGRYDVFGDTMGDYNAIIGTIDAATNFDLRPKDVIAYVSPKFEGLQVTLATVHTGTEANNTGPNPFAYSASAVYSSGPLSAALAYEVHKNGAAVWDDHDNPVTGTKLGLGYTLGDLKLGLVYEMLDGDNNKQYTRDALYVSGEMKFGNEKLKLALGQAKDTDAQADTGATLIAAGIEHGFSKRTAIYALYAMTRNDDNATYGIGQGGAGGKYQPTAAGEDPSCISIGMQYNF